MLYKIKLFQGKLEYFYYYKAKTLLRRKLKDTKRGVKDYWFQCWVLYYSTSGTQSTLNK